MLHECENEMYVIQRLSIPDPEIPSAVIFQRQIESALASSADLGRNKHGISILST